MPSIRAKLVNRYLRSTMKTLPLHEIEPERVRAIFEKRLVPGLPKGIVLEEVESPIKGEWHRLASGEGERTILYFHGGGYIFGSPKTHRSLTYPLALAAKANVFSLEYRLAPEHSCPAAIEDAIAAYQWLRATGHDPKHISFAGDSAGGGLALAALQTLRVNGDPLPASAVLYSPYTDLALEGAALKDNVKSDVMFQEKSIQVGAMYYQGDLDARDPRCSPLYGDMHGLPPLLIFASNSEMLLDDSTRLVRRAEQEGVDVSFIRRDGLAHVWPLFHPLMPEAKIDIDESAAFLRKHFVAT